MSELYDVATEKGTIALYANSQRSGRREDLWRRG